MKKVLSILVLLLPFIANAQFGIKAGVNFANVTKASSISNSSKSGFHAGVFLAPSTKGVIGSRTELIFSRQGYNFKTATNTGEVNLDYILLPQYMTINITKYFQLQLGGQMGILLNAKADSAATNPSMPGPAGKMMNFYNKFDFGYGGGIEVHPVSGLIVGARVNISLGNLYKDISTTTPGETPSFVPKVNVKNNLFQIFAGWRFGKSEK
jgi:hypothetical protein